MLQTIQYENGGLFVSEGNWIHPTRRIDTTEIIVVKNGQFDLKEDETIYKLKKGDVLQLTRGLLHGGTATCSEPISFFWFHFRGNLPEQFLEKHFALSDDYAVDVLCRQLLHYANTPDYPSEAADCMIRLLLLELRVQANVPSEGSRLLSEVCAWIRAHDTRPVTAAEIASRFGYNEDYLSRLFRARFRCGLKQYIVRSRLQRIKTYLLSSDYTLQQIAEMTGFSDYKAFLKFFAYHEGSAPTAYRALYRNTHVNVR